MCRPIEELQVKKFQNGGHCDKNFHNVDKLICFADYGCVGSRIGWGKMIRKVKDSKPILLLGKKKSFLPFSLLAGLGKEMHIVVKGHSIV